MFWAIRLESDKGMKIAFFIGSMVHGGAERVISILANDYRRHGWDVDIVLLLKNLVEYPLDSGIRIVDLSPDKGGYIQNAFPGWERSAVTLSGANRIGWYPLLDGSMHWF